MNKLTMGSLFDGIGGFIYAGNQVGIDTLWSSEIDPCCEAVTKHHFPNVVQMGDITKIKGAEVTPVDIVCGGSPCQDLSVAGKRAGLAGERSGLYMEQIRIIREMRNATNGKYPRYMVWENVPGALSSNKGEDFHAVLEEAARCAEDGVSIPQPNKWGNAGDIVGNGWSIVWRILDAQYWGVPQRRRRIFLVADFGSERAGEILFEPEGLRGYSTESRKERKGSAADAEGRIKGSNHDSVRVFTNRGYDAGDKAETMRAASHGAIPMVAIFCAAFMGGQGAKARTIAYSENVSPSIKSVPSGGNTVPDIVYGVDCRNATVESELTHTLQAKPGGGISLNCTPSIVQKLASGADATGTLMACHAQKQWIGNQEAFSGNYHIVASGKNRKYIIRRLTPLECDRLQGYPDNWTQVQYRGKSMSDSARYRMDGNSVAIPCVIRVLSGIAAQHNKIV